MADTPTTAHLLNLVKALAESDAGDAKILEELDRHTAIVERSVELRRMRAQALCGVGRLGEAREIAAALLASPGDEVDAAIYANVALVSGRWRDLKTLAKEEWDPREARSPAHLVQVGQLCSAEDPEEALRLGGEAAGAGRRSAHRADRRSAHDATSWRCYRPFAGGERVGSGPSRCGPMFGKGEAGRGRSPLRRRPQSPACDTNFVFR